jgi:hypothetical protein
MKLGGRKVKGFELEDSGLCVEVLPRDDPKSHVTIRAAMVHPEVD